MSVRTTNFDAIAAAAPLNREASTVRDGSGDIWSEPDVSGGQLHWKEPPQPLEARPKGVGDISGAKYGRLTVVRYHGRSGVSTPVRVWLVRCACGDYEVRREKSIIRALQGDTPPVTEHSCRVCEHVQILQLKARSKSTKKRRRQDAGFLDRLATAAR